MKVFIDYHLKQANRKIANMRMAGIENVISFMNPCESFARDNRLCEFYKYTVIVTVYQFLCFLWSVCHRKLIED
jgi:hypothetical protein